MNNIIEARGLIKSYEAGRVKALDGLNLEIEDGDFVSIMGPSGSGKSTLLNMIGGLDKPDEGELIVDGQDLTRKRDLTAYRSEMVGFVFQLHNLIPSQTALENVILPMFEGKLKSADRRERALHLLDLVGIADRAQAYPPQLSGGERQRVAIARALANSPKIILADEPTGSLDSKNSAKIMDLLAAIREKEKKTLIMVTHELDIGRRADRIIRMIDGQVAEVATTQ